MGLTGQAGPQAAQQPRCRQLQLHSRKLTWQRALLCYKQGVHLTAQGLGQGFRPSKHCQNHDQRQSQSLRRNSG